MKLEKDRIVRRLQAAAGLAFEELPADDLAVVAEAVGEPGVAGVEPHAGEVLIAEARGGRRRFPARDAERQGNHDARHGRPFAAGGTITEWGISFCRFVYSRPPPTSPFRRRRRAPRTRSGRRAPSLRRSSPGPPRPRRGRRRRWP